MAWMAPLLGACTALVVSALEVRSIVSHEDCNGLNQVVFDRVDVALRTRTLVVEDSQRQRMLILMADSDRSVPCQLQWWLDHNPQGVIQCTNAQPATGAEACAPSQCGADASRIELGYVRTMLASALFMPQQHTMSALCVAMGCQSHVIRTKPGAGSLLEETSPWQGRVSPKRVLVLGLGSSTMALWLRASLPKTELHVAELVPNVVAAAPCFGLDNTDPLLKLHVADGRQFLQNGTSQDFDAILVDAFDPNASLPACLRTQQFFAAARKRLVPGGALVLNLLSGEKSLQILKALAVNFDAHNLWIGRAPGADGIQDVVTAFAPGRRQESVGPQTVQASAQAQAQEWLASAQFHQLKSGTLNSVHAFQDATECPTQNT